MFNELLLFLLQEKRVIAYMDHDLRVTGKFLNVHHSIVNENIDERNDDLRNKLRELEKNTTPIRNIWWCKKWKRSAPA